MSNAKTRLWLVGVWCIFPPKLDITSITWRIMEP